MMAVDELTRAIGVQVRKHREKCGWTQEELGRRIAADRSQICRYENGLVRPNTSTIIRLADELGVSTADLLGDSPGDIAAQFEDWLLRLPLLHREPLRNLVNSYFATHKIDDLMGSKRPPSHLR